MHFHLPEYKHPDFSALTDAPDAKTALVEADGVAPENFHSTSMFFIRLCRISKPGAKRVGAEIVG